MLRDTQHGGRAILLRVAETAQLQGAGERCRSGPSEPLHSGARSNERVRLWATFVSQTHLHGRTTDVVDQSDSNADADPPVRKQSSSTKQEWRQRLDSILLERVTKLVTA